MFRQRESRWNMRKSQQRESRWNGRMFRQRESRWNRRMSRQPESQWNMRKSQQRESRWECPSRNPIEAGVLFGAVYRGALVTDSLENMDCGAVQAVERVGGAACASGEERDKGRLDRSSGTAERSGDVPQLSDAGQSSQGQKHSRKVYFGIPKPTNKGNTSDGIHSGQTTPDHFHHTHP
uniref:Uncharacterized protein n=1 Tax=Timema tahoe TaxID=61484 RepID=A0A7R9IJ50_9NEOP|nr:unnamed protein product [Timema tahoe]